MKAARYIGRVGGLAVALGVGTAVFTGYGVASAETGSEGSASSSASSSASGSESSGSAESSGSTDSSGSAGSSDDGGGEDSDADGVDDSDADDDSAADDADLSDDLADELADDDLDEDAAEEETGSSGSGGSGSAGSDDADLADAVADLDDEAAALEDAVEDEASSSSVVSLASATLNPATDDEPPAPAGAPVDLMLAAATRRETSGGPATAVAAPEQAAAEVTSAGLFDDKIEVTLVPAEFKDGILLGVIEAFSKRGFELRYTVVDEPTDGSKTTLINSTQCEQITSCADAFPGQPADSGDYTLLPDLSVLQSGGTSTFDVLISEVTPFDAAFEKLLGTTLGPLLVPKIMDFLHQLPILGDLLAPVIGYSKKQLVSVDVGELIPDPDNTPAAFTVKIPSVDGAMISTNYFPVSGAKAGDAPVSTILNGPGLGSAGSINPFDPVVAPTPALPIPGMSAVREDFNYVSWDPRGEHASTGILQLDNPMFEGRDVMHIIDYLVKENLTATEGTTRSGAPDPLIGMIGGSYGGGIQLVVAGIDQRVDAIAPGIAWNSLNEAIYPENAFKTAWANLLFLDLVSIGADINSQIPQAILTGNLFGTISESAQAVLTSSGPTVLVESITAPTMLIQGIQDGLFVLEQSIQNGKILTANEVPTKMIWFCGGHGLCLNPKAESQFEGVAGATLTWMRKFVNGDDVAVPKNFQWFAQLGGHFVADLFPFDDGFAGPTIDAQSDGGFLPILPLGIGGSGPSKDPAVPGLLKGATASEASNALEVLITTPGPETLIVGAPQVTFTYSGFGNSEFVYGQIVNVATGLVLGNLVKPIPVTLDGKTHTVTWDLENVAYTSPEAENAELKFQLTSAASPYARWDAWGGINVTDLEVKLPTVAPGVAERVVG